VSGEIHEAGVERMNYLYMGFYIHSCPKMRYKGEYFPSFLADPVGICEVGRCQQLMCDRQETYDWVALEKCVPALNTHRYACFSNPSHSIAGSHPADLPGGNALGRFLLLLVQLRHLFRYWAQCDSAGCPGSSHAVT
jgi:arginine-tRNA-protein transferase